MELIRKVVASYGINQCTIEQITNNVHQINDGHNVYALKRSTLSSEIIPNWENVFHQAYSQRIAGILPVYVTSQESLYKELNGDYWYLTPWVSGSKPTIEQVYRVLGKIHTQTKHSQTNDFERMRSQFNIYKVFCENTEKELQTYIEQFESIRYMSPFELQVCTHYRDLELVLRKVNERINQLIEEQIEQSKWSYNLCHGNLTFSHFIHSSQTYVINWEKSHYENAVLDLASFLKSEVTAFDTPTESFINSFSDYMDENKLTNCELYLLVIHLLDPTNYITVVRQYVNGTSKQTMIDQVKSLQQTYRQLLFGLEWSEYVTKEYETMKLDDLDS